MREIRDGHISIMQLTLIPVIKMVTYSNVGKTKALIVLPSRTISTIATRKGKHIKHIEYVDDTHGQQKSNKPTVKP